MGDALDEARERMFVGREAELEELGDVLARGESAHVHGPGGMGKTELLRAVGRLARRREREVVAIDARARSNGAELRRSRQQSPPVILVDAVDETTDLDRLVDQALGWGPRRRAAVVTTGRAPRANADTTLALGPLSRADCIRFLERAEVPEGRRQAIARACGGHPLALTIYARVARHAHTDPCIGDHPDLVQVLVRRLLRDLPDERERTVLRAAALVLRARRSLIAHLEPDRATELWTWLAGLPFVERGNDHLALHDVVREALVADLRWRDPSGLVRLQRRVACHYLSSREPAAAERLHLLETAGAVPQEATTEAIRRAIQRLAADRTPRVIPPSMDRRAFTREVKRALRHFDRRDLLSASPLTGCRMVLSDGCARTAEQRAERLQALLHDACEAVRDVDGDVRGWQTLHRTYLCPAVKQLAAAHDLRLSYGTYRRALADATARVVERLWSLETDSEQ